MCYRGLSVPAWFSSADRLYDKQIALVMPKDGEVVGAIVSYLIYRHQFRTPACSNLALIHSAALSYLPR
jgi:hypothetical protein